MHRIAEGLCEAAIRGHFDTWQAVKAGSAVDQAILRRIVSTAYYGAFHSLVEKSVGLVAGDAPPALQAALARTFDHAAMKRLARAIRSGQPPQLIKGVFRSAPQQLRSLSQAFTFLQDERHAADYDLSVLFTESRVQQAIVAMLEVTKELRNPVPETSYFLTLLPVAGQLRNR